MNIVGMPPDAATLRRLADEFDAAKARKDTADREQNFATCALNNARSALGKALIPDGNAPTRAWIDGGVLIVEPLAHGEFDIRWIADRKAAA